MAIIRNERARNRDPEPQDEPEVEEEEVDYDWHPTEEEYVSPLTADQWAELLSSPSFIESDQAKAIRCLREYGGPATFQQLSIRYRGTMGRYRRWLSEAAQQAGERFGVPAPQKDRFGMDEWWPLLYQTRATGKVGAGIFEMTLRPEVEDAFLRLEEQEREARRAENARNLKRIEQLERARQEERERRAAAAHAELEPPQDMASEVDGQEVDEPVAESLPTPQVVESAQDETPASVAPVVEEPAEEEPPTQVLESGTQLQALVAFLEAMEADERAGGTRFVPAAGDVQETMSLAVAAPIDYALRYAERLRYVLALMREADPRLCAASIARAVGDDSVATIQDVLNGQQIPSFAYLGKLQDELFVNVERLEVMDGQEIEMPVFRTLQELRRPQEVASLLCERLPAQIAYVVDDSKSRRTGMVVRFSDTACVLLTRQAVDAQPERSKNPRLDAFVSMVDELDDFARERHVERTSHQLSAEQWNNLVAGRIWPGRVLG